MCTASTFRNWLQTIELNETEIEQLGGDNIQIENYASGLKFHEFAKEYELNITNFEYSSFEPYKFHKKMNDKSFDSDV